MLEEPRVRREEAKKFTESEIAMQKERERRELAMQKEQERREFAALFLADMPKKYRDAFSKTEEFATFIETVKRMKKDRANVKIGVFDNAINIYTKKYNMKKFDHELKALSDVKQDYIREQTSNDFFGSAKANAKNKSTSR